MSLILLIAAAAAPAAAEAPTAAVQAAPAAQTGVIAYPPEFFADVSPTSAFDMVQRLPGFTFERGEAVRGLAGSGGNVLIDGRPPVSKNDSLEEFLRRIPVSAVARIELIRGGAPGIDMQGRTVIANVVRRSDAGFTGAVMLTYHGIYDGRTLGGLRAQSQWRSNGRLLENSIVLGKGPDDWLGDGARVRYGPNGEVLIRSTVDADAQGLRAWTTAAFETPAAGGRLRLNGAYMKTPADAEIIDRRIVPGGREYEYNTRDRLQAELGGRFNRALGESTSLEALAFQQWDSLDLRGHFEAPGLSRDFFSDKQISETVGRLTLRHAWSPRLNLEGGTEGALNVLESQTRLVINGAPVRLPAANVEVEEKRAEVFAVATWRPRVAFSLEGALRQEFSTITSEGDVTLEKSLAFTKPRLSATFTPAPGRQLRARIEREVGQLNFDDFVATSSVLNTGNVVAGNPDLDPEQAWVAEAAFEQRFWGSGALVVTARHYELTDVIDRAPIYGPGGVVADAPGNIGDGTKDELGMTLSLPLDRLRAPNAVLKADVLWRHSEVTDPVTLQPREISGLEPVDWNVHLTQNLPNWKVNWGVDVYGGFRESYYGLREIETIKLDTWVTVFAEYKPRPDIIWRVEVQNLTERSHERIREVYAGPRDRAPLAYVDVRDLPFGRMLLIRFRKAFG